MTHPATCKFCGAAIVWRRVGDRDIPYNDTQGPAIRPHWSTCPAYAELLEAARRGWDRGVKEQR